jgi:ring-1,2-phenylacetyl-CoA epoxidase subunit PaaC
VHAPDTDNPYVTLTEVGGDARWAFGGGFDDPLEGVDTAVPAGLDAGSLAAVSLALGDESLLLAQSLLRWTTHAPELEEEVTLANVALDLLGQTRLLYARAAAADPGVVPQLPEGSPVPAEDRLAFFRDPGHFRVGALAVMPDADFATLMLRLALVTTWRDALWRELVGCPDPVLAAVASRAVAEVGYHRDVSTRWVSVLAGGTAESAARLARAQAVVAPHIGSLCALPAGATDPLWTELWARAQQRCEAELEDPVVEQLAEDPVVEQRCEASARRDHPPATSTPAVEAWRDELVTELQSIARQHPMGRW